MASRRQSLKALAEERGLRVVRVYSPDESHVGFWSAFAERHRSDADVAVHAPTRRAAEAGLRAALEAMPLQDITGVGPTYQDLLAERGPSGCTPEQQAGPDARVCATCGRRAIHQICSDWCMACNAQRDTKEPDDG